MATFDERAREWDTPERSERAEVVAAAIRASVPLTPTTRTIDIGAGTGLLGFALADDIGDLVLAEPSEGMREVIGEKLAASGRADVTAIPFDLTAGPPPGKPFDLAISLLVLHHVADTAIALAAILPPGHRRRHVPRCRRGRDPSPGVRPRGARRAGTGCGLRRRRVPDGDRDRRGRPALPGLPAPGPQSVSRSGT